MHMHSILSSGRSSHEPEVSGRLSVCVFSTTFLQLRWVILDIHVYGKTDAMLLSRLQI